MSVYNRTVPPFIVALSETRRSTSKVKPPAANPLPAADDTPCTFDNDSDSDASSSMADVPDPYGALHREVLSGSASNHSGDMDGSESAIKVSPNSVWSTGLAPVFRSDQLTPTRSPPPENINRVKCLIFSYISERDVQVATLYPSQS